MDYIKLVHKSDEMTAVSRSMKEGRRSLQEIEAICVAEVIKENKGAVVTLQSNFGSLGFCYADLNKVCTEVELAVSAAVNGDELHRVLTVEELAKIIFLNQF